MTLLICLYLWGAVASATAILCALSLQGMSLYDFCEEEDLPRRHIVLCLLVALLLWPLMWACVVALARRK